MMNGKIDDQDYGHFYDTDVLMPTQKQIIIHGNRYIVRQYSRDYLNIPLLPLATPTTADKKENTTPPCDTDECSIDKGARINAKHFICILGIVTTSLILFECWVFYGLGI